MTQIARFCRLRERESTGRKALAALRLANATACRRSNHSEPCTPQPASLHTPVVFRETSHSDTRPQSPKTSNRFKPLPPTDAATASTASGRRNTDHAKPRKRELRAEQEDNARSTTRNRQNTKPLKNNRNHLMAKNTARVVLFFLLRFRMYLFLAQKEQVHLFVVVFFPKKSC